jgi:putative transposase
LSHEERKHLIVPEHPEFSLLRQAELLDISRSSLYYAPKENPEDKKIMDLIDVIYTDLPFYGSRRMKNELLDRYRICACREHIQRLMRKMGIETIYPKKTPNTSASDASHKKYPYLLKDLTASYPNHIWGTDITYIRTEEGWAYLVALIDWYSRYVIAWEISTSMETEFCMSTLNRALVAATPSIHNSDQGVQFTDKKYIGILEENKIGISMDGRGRCMDNIFTERLWRTVKYENIYLSSYRNAPETKEGLGKYFPFYNEKRRHQSLDYRTPAEVYFENKK